MKSMVRSLVLAVTAPLVLFGCADLNAPTALPSAPRFSESSSTGLDLDKLALYNNPLGTVVTSAKKQIGPEGGRLDLHGFAIDVPAGAVSQVTEFQIRIPVESDGSTRVVAEFLPHGATFSKPVTIEFPFAGTSLVSASAPIVVWWNNGWVNMGGSVTADGSRLRTTTDHFSTYGTTDERGGGVVVAGG